MAGNLLSPMDAMFLQMESSESMMHVAGLIQVKPTGNATEVAGQLRDELMSMTDVQPPWNMKLQTPGLLKNPLHRWVEDDKFDIDYHVRRSALASPGDERELGTLVSRLHSHPLDFSRPPWEAHLIEGLENGNLALYVKVHHSLVDGYTAMKTMIRSMSSDPSVTDTPFFFQMRPPEREPREAEESTTDLGAVLSAVGSQLTSVKDIAGAVLRLNRTRRKEEDALVPSLQAPHTIFNVRIGRNRRFATQQYNVERLKAVAKASGGTLNDVALAICGGGLRTYLADLGELPDKPLIAFVPVNVRPKDDPGGGNAVGGMLASLGTNIADPAERMQAIIASTRAAKEQMESMTRNAILAYTMFLAAPFVVQTGVARANLAKAVAPTFNVVMSNVPGPRESLYFRGNRMESVYPVSIPVHGVALNITCESYADTLNFGFIGCREAVPRLQRLAVACGHALEELESVYGS
ncbi:wax ester/triacylglycerol synthase family O-acyltransferase [Antrihabitans sp. YC2-6]|uniref:WS/DGAT/MGAT family O-acyltransferase n=1 Tax=Antrihabitans sp. YC2-6 TaxID=2799498 RepID=UPI0018F52FD7|nr:wax ester/triacylglycerol synthase family O-acyltransferase [Antrihabitans sp. YC2-6]MBJ8345237.1 wax ester/triacylglycerol synthase family O-acyltransferase [Antrihabitans sp. YC2-6]